MSLIAYEKEAEIKQLLTEHLDSTYQVILHLLNHSDLLEHGSGSGGSWLSTYGQEYIKDFESCKDADEFEHKFVSNFADPCADFKYQDLFFDNLRQCGCGNPGMTLELFYQILKLLESNNV